MLIALILCALAALLGWLWQGWPGAAAGVAAVALALLGLEALRGRRMLRWLGEGEAASAPPALGGLWGQAAYRVTRALRGERERERQSAQRLADFLAAMQASPVGVVLLDAQGRIQWCNGVASQHLGLDPRRDLLQHIGNLVREPAFAACLAGPGEQREVTLAGRQDTPTRPVRLSVQLHAYGQGQQLILSHDITALAQAEAMRRNFVSNVSHELRTPLTVLCGFVETLQTLPLDESERARYLDLMAGQAGRMRALIDDLLAFSRLEGSPPPGLGEPVHLPALMAQCEAEARALSNLLHPPEGQAPAQRLRFAGPPAFDLLGAAGELRSAIANLIHNAVRYTPAGGAIDVGWERLEGGGARLSVADTGPGIAPEHLTRLGERFYRVDPGRSREAGGTGLGLAIVKHVVQRHDGQLEITSSPGKGSRFAIALPPRRVRELEGAAAGVER